MQPVLDHHRYREQALNLRTQYLFGSFPARPFGKRRRSARIAGAALVVAVAAFWAVMLVSPPMTEADETRSGRDPLGIMTKAPGNLPIEHFDPM
jgi:hypothetical protein